MTQIYKVPLYLEPQPEGGYTVTSPLLPELVTEGDTLDESIENARDALMAVIEIYEDRGRPLPENVLQADSTSSISFDCLITTPRDIAKWRGSVSVSVVTRRHVAHEARTTSGTTRRPAATPSPTIPTPRCCSSTSAATCRTTRPAR